AVLVPLLEEAGEAAVVVTQRSATMRNHRDDWVFPGGGMQDSDVDAPAGARREAAEELGIRPEAIEIIGQLATRGPIPTGYQLDVFVGVVDPRATLRPDPGEVADIEVLTLRELHSGDRYQLRHGIPPHMPGLAAMHVPARSEYAGPFDFFEVRPGQWLWGMQGQILKELLDHLVTFSMDDEQREAR
ncbi:MAG TPA: CoA pyrophosphatase, partial [Mycobacteriales bacterium]|nr:CoA pyrophosphatase [Mycobacteriales bacterium]